MPPGDEAENAEEGGRQSADGLRGDVPLNRELTNRLLRSGVVQIQKRKDTPSKRIIDAQATQAEQNTKWRITIFWSVIALIAAGFLLSAVVLCVYVFSARSAADPTVLAAWFGASVVQTLGLFAIITRSLFPDGSKSGEPAP